MASGIDDFLYKDDLDAVLAITDADMFANNEDMESEIVTCIKNLPSRENCSFKCGFYQKVCLSKAGLSRHEKAKHQQHSAHDSVSHSDSGSSRSKLELTHFSLMYQKSAQKLSTDECYPDSVMEEFKNFNASFDDFMPYYKLILPVVNSFSGDTEKFYPQIYKLYSQAENYKNLSHDCSLILSFDVVNQILAHLTGAKIHSDILVYENSDISTLTEKDISIISYLSGYVFGTFYRRLRSMKSNTSSYYQQQCLSFLMAGKCSGENLPLPEHKHIEILDRGGLWKVDNNVILIFKVAECHFKTITSVPTTKIDSKSIVSTLMKNPIIHENMSKIRSKSTDTIVKREIALNLLQDLLTLYIRVRTFSFAKGQIQSHKIKQSRLKSRSLRTSLKKVNFEN